MIARVLRERGRDLAVPSKKTGSGATGTANSGMIRWPRVCGQTGTKCERSKVSPSEGNEVRREDCQEVGVPHSSVEAGERALPDPVERRGCRVVDQTPNPRRGHRASLACLVRRRNV